MSTLQPDGSYLSIEEMPRKQLEEEYRRTNYFLARILKKDGVRMTPTQYGVAFIVGQDPRGGDYRIYYSISEDGEETKLEVRPHG